MKVIYGFGKLPKGAQAPQVVAVGVFDGLHRGHQALLRCAVAEARKRRIKSAVLTFAFHPSHAFMPSQKIPHLCTLAQKLSLIKKEGIDRCYVIDFNTAFASMAPLSFVRDLLVKKLNMAALYIGEDFVFGKGARGDRRLLLRLSARFGFKLCVLHHLRLKGRVVSSTLIRDLIRKGDLSSARFLLGRPVSIFGRVVAGEGRGKILGFPTANIEPQHDLLVPDGIYATLVLWRGRKFKSVTYIGSKPTFSKRRKKRHVEVFLFGLKKDLYGQEMEVLILKKIRDDRAFASPVLLCRQIKRDVAAARKILKKTSL